MGFSRLSTVLSDRQATGLRMFVTKGASASTACLSAVRLCEGRGWQPAACTLYYVAQHPPHAKMHGVAAG